MIGPSPGGREGAASGAAKREVAAWGTEGTHRRDGSSACCRPSSTAASPSSGALTVRGCPTTPTAAIPTGKVGEMFERADSDDDAKVSRAEARAYRELMRAEGGHGGRRGPDRGVARAVWDRALRLSDRRLGAGVPPGRRVQGARGRAGRRGRRARAGAERGRRTYRDRLRRAPWASPSGVSGEPDQRGLGVPRGSAAARPGASERDPLRALGPARPGARRAPGSLVA